MLVFQGFSLACFLFPLLRKREEKTYYCFEFCFYVNSGVRVLRTTRSDEKGRKQLFYLQGQAGNLNCYLIIIVVIINNNNSMTWLLIRGHVQWRRGMVETNGSRRLHALWTFPFSPVLFYFCKLNHYWTHLFFTFVRW